MLSRFLIGLTLTISLLWPAAVAGEDYSLQARRAEALIRSGHVDQGIAVGEMIAKATSDPHILNDLAYCLADKGSALDVAEAWAEQALSKTEQATAKASLTSFDIDDLSAVNTLAAGWDTLGWIHFKMGDLAKAERYVDASWHLSQHAAVAGHLAQIYDKQGRNEDAVHMGRLGFALYARSEQAQEQLEAGPGQPAAPSAANGRTAERLPAPSPDEELRNLRTIMLPALTERGGSADVLLLLSRKGIEDVRIIDKFPDLEDAAHALQTASYEFPFPDEGPEKIILGGTLFCSGGTTPICQLNMAPASSTPLAPSQLKQPHGSYHASPPTLRSKVSPEYSEAAMKARLEGTVVLSIVIDEAGIPEDISVIRSLGMGLNESATECVSKWRFNPATKDGKPVAAMAEVEVNFVLIKKPQ